MKGTEVPRHAALLLVLSYPHAATAHLLAPQRHAAPRLCAAGRPHHVAALDFDGVIVDSEPELTRAAWRASLELWPEQMAAAREFSQDPRLAGARRAWAGGEWQPLLGDGDDDLPRWLAAKMRLLRPAIETGYETMLLMRLCVDEALAARRPENAAFGRRPLSVGEITANWDGGMRDSLLARYGLAQPEAVEAYGATRDAWIAADEAGWLATNRFYDGAVDALRSCVAEGETEVYIVTTKQRRFAQALLRSAGVELDDERVFGLGSGPKAETLCALRERHRAIEPECTMSFVEDKAETLLAVAADARLLGSPTLYFAPWGYSTGEQKALAARLPRVRTLADDDSSLRRVLRAE